MPPHGSVDWSDDVNMDVIHDMTMEPSLTLQTEFSLEGNKNRIGFLDGFRKGARIGCKNNVTTVNQTVAENQFMSKSNLFVDLNRNCKPQ